MSDIVRRLAPILMFEFVTKLMVFSGVIVDGYLSDFLFLTTLSISPFLAGYIFARANYSVRLRFCSIVGVSISLASIVAVAIAFAFQAESGEFWLAIAGFILSTILVAVTPQLLFGLLGGWVARKHHVESCP